MSYLDIATLAFHRRNEMEARIEVFLKKTDSTICGLKNLKTQAKGLVNQLNCDPGKLKDRFLNGMRHLDELIYLVTDLNLSLEKFQELYVNEDTPVQDNCLKPLTPIPAPFNILDVLSEPTPSTSTACSNHCPVEKPKKQKRYIPKEEQTLILFSSSSNSSESCTIIPAKERKSERKVQEIQCSIIDKLEKIKISEPEEVLELPAQSVLEPEHEYPAFIIHVDGATLWIVTEDPLEVQNFMKEMSEYYQKHPKELTEEEVNSLTYCAFLDESADQEDMEGVNYYRGLFIRAYEESSQLMAEVYLVDTGEMRSGRASALRPLCAAHAGKPPYARCCHLAGIELTNAEDKAMAELHEQFLKQYMGSCCSIEVDDNTSESLGVFVMVSGATETINQLMVDQGLAVSVMAPPQPSKAPLRAICAPSVASTPDRKPDLSKLASALDMADTPEYEDPLEAVTGYSSRDEADICKHYKGPPEKTCFKGSRCTKRHVVIRPDGWTLDRVSVAAKCPSLPLPAPDTWLRALVTCVSHFDRIYVQLEDNVNKEEKPLPSFGVVLPPATLAELVRDMNSPAALAAYRSLKLAPAPGELVAACYPPDGRWYRAVVISVVRVDQNVQVMYVDYGNIVWVKEDAVRVLPSLYCALPAQAICCALAGVRAASRDPAQWANARAALAGRVQDQLVRIHVISRDYDEITIELLDGQDFNVAEQMAATGHVTLHQYDVIDDSHVTRKLIVP